jgi:hypothetical protein
VDLYTWSALNGSAQFSGSLLFTVVRFGLAGIVCVSLLAASSDLAASPPLQPQTHGVSKIIATTPSSGDVGDRISVKPPVGAPVANRTPPVITLVGLRQRVETWAAHPQPIRPEVACLASTVYREAANQDLEGQLAVAQVIVNRTRSTTYPKTLCAVVDQPGQFSHGPVAARGTATRTWRKAVAIAMIAAEQRVAQVAPGALYFHESHIRPSWSRDHQRIAQIGDHIFYR